MGLTKDRNGRDLTEVEDIKKKWQEYTELLEGMMLKLKLQYYGHLM